MDKNRVKMLVQELKDAGLDVYAKTGKIDTETLTYDKFLISITNCPLASSLLSYATSQKAYLTVLASKRSKSTSPKSRPELTEEL